MTDNIFNRGIKHIVNPKTEWGGKVTDMIIIESMGALERWMRINEQNPLANITSSHREDDDDNWSGTRNLEEWYEMMHKGDAKVISKIKQQKEKTQKHLGGYTPKGYIFDVVGEFFDIGEVLSNKPECWLNPIVPEEDNQITIRISTSANAGVDSDAIIEGAGTLLGYVGELERQGYKVRVENILFSMNVDKKRRDRTLMTKTVVKDFNDFINFAKMSAIISPALQRRGTFMLKEQLFQKNLGGGYGRTEQLEGVTTIHDRSAMKTLKNKLFQKETK